MILTSLFLACVLGFWNRPPKLKARRTGRCVFNPWCFENHMECLLNSEVWNSILILSCLSALLPMTEAHTPQGLRELQIALNDREHLFKKSEARLYTPNIETIQHCTSKFLDCFLMEMNVLLYEEDPTQEFKKIIEATIDTYNNKSCIREEHYCELQELTNSQDFFAKMKTFLELQLSVCKDIGQESCD